VIEQTLAFFKRATTAAFQAAIRKGRKDGLADRPRRE
jgi:hypothetical protein